MANPAQWFAEGGPMMLAVLALDLVGLLALAVAWLMALVARVRGRTGFLVKAVPALVMMGAFLPMIAGAFGYIQSRSAAIDAASTASPAMQAELLAMGFELAQLPLRFGGISTIILGLLAVLALMIAPWGARR